MGLTACIICGREFQGRWKKRSKFCSLPCRKAGRPNYYKQYNCYKYEEVRKRNEAYRLKNPLKYIWSASKFRAKENNLEFNIKEEDLLVPEVCPILKTKFERKTRYAMSLDRIDPNKGYIPGNVQVISRKANVMKNDASPEELLAFADWVYKTYK